MKRDTDAAGGRHRQPPDAQANSCSANILYEHLLQEMNSGLMPSHAQGMGNGVRRWGVRYLWPQTYPVSNGYKGSDAACLPGCGLYLGEELLSSP